MLHRMKRKNGNIGKNTIPTTLFYPLTIHKISSWSMTGIFKYPKSILISNFAKFFHIMRVTGKIHRDKTFKSSFWITPQQQFQFPNIHQVSITIYITKYNFTPTIADTISTSCKRHRSNNHLISRFDPQSSCG